MWLAPRSACYGRSANTTTAAANLSLARPGSGSAPGQWACRSSRESATAVRSAPAARRHRGRARASARPPAPASAEAPSRSGAAARGSRRRRSALGTARRQPSRSGHGVRPMDLVVTLRTGSTPTSTATSGLSQTQAGSGSRQNWQRGPPPSSTGQPSRTTPTRSRCWLPGGAPDSRRRSAVRSWSPSRLMRVTRPATPCSRYSAYPRGIGGRPSVWQAAASSPPSSAGTWPGQTSSARHSIAPFWSARLAPVEWPIARVAETPGRSGRC